MTQTFDAALRRFAPQLPLAIAFSGGADSTALLVACARAWPGQVVALHVNHGLQPAALDFEAHCARLCQVLDVPLRIARVDAQKRTGESPEDVARIARYQGLDRLARESHAGVAIQSIALAQHADDQVETILLALSRGSGLPGLSAMPAQWSRAGLSYYRPLLQVSGEAIRQWLQAQGIAWVEDPSNADTRYTRNRIRHQIVPPLAKAFAHYRESFVRVAQHAAQAQSILEEVAHSDLRLVAMESGRLLKLDALRALSAARQANVVRFWLQTEHATTASAAQMGALLAQVAVCTTRGHHIHLKVGQGFVRRDGAGLAWYNFEVLHPKN